VSRIWTTLTVHEVWSWRSWREIANRSSKLLLHCNHSCRTRSLRLLCGSITIYWIASPDDAEINVTEDGWGTASDERRLVLTRGRIAQRRVDQIGLGPTDFSRG
jgi:hypothetical protein